MATLSKFSVFTARY